MSQAPSQRVRRSDSAIELPTNTSTSSAEGEAIDGTQDNELIELGRTVSPQQTRRCWICFEEEEESQIRLQGSESNWRHPCKCSLLAHEECLLTWVDETQKSSAQGVNSSRTIRCPQCKEPYKIRSKHSLSVSLMTFADGWITRALLATIPLGFAKAIGINCFYYGQGAMLDVLGEDRLTDVVLALKPGDEIRYLIGASCIPFALIGSRFDFMSLNNFILPLIPSIVCFSDTSFMQAHRPMESSPALWICVLPWLRNIYCFVWKKLISPLESRWKMEAGLIKDNVTEFAPGIGFREVPAQVPQVAGDGAQRANMPDEQADQEEDAVAERWIFVEAPKFARLIAGALLLPKISVAAGNLLCRLPNFKTRFPQKFQRVILGGITFVLLKDVLGLLYLYNRAKGRSTRHIVNRPKAKIA